MSSGSHSIYGRCAEEIKSIQSWARHRYERLKRKSWEYYSCDKYIPLIDVVIYFPRNLTPALKIPGSMQVFQLFEVQAIHSYAHPHVPYGGKSKEKRGRVFSKTPAVSFCRGGVFLFCLVSGLAGDQALELIKKAGPQCTDLQICIPMTLVLPLPSLYLLFPSPYRPSHLQRPLLGRWPHI